MSYKWEAMVEDLTVERDRLLKKLEVARNALALYAHAKGQEGGAMVGHQVDGRKITDWGGIAQHALNALNEKTE